MVCDDIENNKYGYVTIQNNGAMKIVNFTHVQMAEIRHSSLHYERWVQGYISGSLSIDNQLARPSSELTT